MLGHINDKKYDNHPIVSCRRAQNDNLTAYLLFLVTKTKKVHMKIKAREINSLTLTLNPPTIITPIFALTPFSSTVFYLMTLLYLIPQLK